MKVENEARCNRCLNAQCGGRSLVPSTVVEGEVVGWARRGGTAPLNKAFGGFTNTVGDKRFK
jgi:hypothetical protein